MKKSSPDVIGLAAISTGWLIVGGIALLFVAPPAASSWPYLAYTGLLVSAYQHGELSLTYPIARGTGPVLVALAAPIFLGEQLAAPDLIAVALIIPGILIIGLAGAGSLVRDRHAILLSLATGVAIAMYTLIDAAGARSGPSPHSYSAWLFVLSASSLLLVTCYLHRSATLTLLRPHLRRGTSVGILSAVVYMIMCGQ